MPFNAALVERIRHLLQGSPDVVEKKMFGGMAFMVRGHMACGPMSDGTFMVRVAAQDTDLMLALPHTTLMLHGGRSMRGFIVIAPEGYAADADLAVWVDRGVAHARTLPPK